MKKIVSLIVNSIAIFITANLLPGIRLSNFRNALGVALALGLINTFVRPFLLILTFPLTILTLGLSTLFVSAFCVMLASWIVPGFFVNDSFSALAFAVVVAIINTLISLFIKKG
jgi:putative membrane protein